MEFVDLTRYMLVKQPHIPPFGELRNMEPVLMTQELQLIDEPSNITYAESLSKKGISVVKIRRRPPVRRHTEQSTFPYRILFEMTSKCNFVCRMCPQQNLKRPKIHMPGELYKKVIDEIDKHGVDGLWLYQFGEPLLHPEFREILRHVSTKTNLGVIWLSTNGRYFHEENIRLVLSSNIDYINFSAHAVTEETYNTVAPPGNFEIVQANLEKFYELKGTTDLPRKPFLHCQMIEQETTKHEIDSFIKKHYQRAEIVSINMLEHVEIPNNAFGFQQRERVTLTTCTKVSRNDCLIYSNGDVTPCEAAYNSEIYFGNINEQSLYDIWNGENRRKIVELNEQGRMSEIEFCRNCTDYDI